MTFLQTALGCVLGFACASAFADLEIAPSQALQCAVMPVERPSYPEDALQRELSGTVKVRLEFTTPVGGPSVEVISSSGDASFVPVVEAHVRKYRIPCMLGSGVVRIQQEFRFTPNAGRKVTWTRARDEQDAQRAGAIACVKHIQPGSNPEYPASERRVLGAGVVLVQLLFTSADTPPLVTIVDPGPRRAFAASVQEWVGGYRMPCFDGHPLRAIQFFRFRMEGENRTAFKDTTLVGFLRGVRDAAKEPRYFDLDQMSCPFDVRLEYRKPKMQNKIGEIGPPVPARMPFLDWLADLQLDIPPRVENAVLGDALTIAVPCGKIDL